MGFVYTQALGYSNPFNNDNTDHGFPHPEAMLHTFRPPAPCELIHSTASWTTDLRIFYRQLEEQQQQLHGRSMEMCCRRPCNTALPADADLWERIHGLVQRKYLASVFVSRADVVYMTSSSRDFFWKCYRITARTRAVLDSQMKGRTCPSQSVPVSRTDQFWCKVKQPCGFTTKAE